MKPDQRPSYLDLAREEGISSGLFLWSVWWKSTIVLLLLLLFLGYGVGFFKLEDATADVVYGLVVPVGICLLSAAMGAVCCALFAVTWRYVGAKALLPPIGALVGAMLGVILIVAILFALAAIQDEKLQPGHHGGGGVIVLVLVVLMKFFAAAGAILGAIFGILLMIILHMRTGRSGRTSSPQSPTSMDS